MLENYKHEKLRFSSGRQVELDIFIPQLSLAFEYQGKQHYKNIYAIGEHRTVQERDNLKQVLCEKANITLIEVPYWWEGSVDTLAATIRQQRPELL